MANENLSRAKLLSDLTNVKLDEATEQVMSARSLQIPIEQLVLCNMSVGNVVWEI